MLSKKIMTELRRRINKGNKPQQSGRLTHVLVDSKSTGFKPQ
ncbi:hypothetical protein RAY_206 [Erwinia phage vB_EamM_RAY]|jgi:hypothetical protein|uniref:Uncharacterized protein n=10 Tax=Agricanvirus TaxID=1984776 RepID=A0A173GEB1_9CAUD|nr:hypothetical protein Ea357_203 [Erwinia phage Ea35-70]YP_009605354.1 hypothetical protein FDH97_gp211 [Erwinia phage vB_EamM_Deimos-Minion]YP_009605672.1 hypothetical protein FDH98_gp312 [Erwinia phage vB_EamM_RAY]YP_009605994.1 hypothetical protein FDH99_gp315 [Erwinia phage vB_EamM_Simmy50]YP_009606314.1 hypothetical protein FDI00_gp208 [Erwinia phage vB_EamM_Special G]YP_009621947.1 hypothetical protein FDJ23_gp206 [Erwinia phage vB_EamM_Desertfox]AUG85994.1 hypothetical protein BOSOLAP